LFRSIELGAQGYLLKEYLGDGLAQAIVDLVEGGAPMTPSIARRVLNQARIRHFLPATDIATNAAPDHNLTKREVDVLNLVAKGFRHAEIATMQGVSTNTINTHIKNIYAKLQVHSRGEAIYEAAQLKIISMVR